VEVSYESAEARVRAIGGTSAERLSAFVSSLISQQYSVGYVCIGHESVETTQIYLDAGLAMKQAVLNKTTPPEGKPGRYRPDDRLLAFLRRL